eukprot:IDg2586t1
MYGLQHAPRRYADGLRAHLRAGGYQPMANESNVYARRTERRTLFMAVTMDDFSVACDVPAMYRQLLGHLRIKYQVKDLGRPKHMLEWSVHQDKETKAIHIKQPHLAWALVQAVGLQRHRSAPTPYHEKADLRAATTNEPIIDVERYQRAIGILRYLVDSTRPDLSVTACHLSRHMQTPTARHWEALRYAARYIVGTAHFHGNNLVAWRTQTIKTVVSSTSDAEYIAASNAARHAGWLQRLLAELCAASPKCVPIAMGNMGALSVATNSAPTKRSKYIDIRHHILREMCARRIIAPYFTSSKHLQADAMTKPL